MEVVQYIKQNYLYIGVGITLICILITVLYIYGNIWLVNMKCSNIISVKTMNDSDIAADMVMSKIGDSIKEFNIIKHTQDKYTILEIPKLLTPEECDEIMETAKAIGMEDSTVLNYGDEPLIELDKKHRKSKQVWLPDSKGPLFEKIAIITQKLTNLPTENQEMLQIVSYEEGGRFNDHYDGCIYEDINYCNKINRNAGERKATLIMYLNDNFEGGETEFVNLNIKIKPKKGKAILFINTTDDQKNIKESMHRGHPVYKGEKWICTKWIHFKKFI